MLVHEDVHSGWLGKKTAAGSCSIAPTGCRQQHFVLQTKQPCWGNKELHFLQPMILAQSVQQFQLLRCSKSEPSSMPSSCGDSQTRLVHCCSWQRNTNEWFWGICWIDSPRICPRSEQPASQSAGLHEWWNNKPGRPECTNRSFPQF